MNFTRDCSLVLYKQLIQTGSPLLLIPVSSVLGFPLYEDTANGRAATHQLYSFAIEFGLAPMCWGAPGQARLRQGENVTLCLGSVGILVKLSLLNPLNLMIRAIFTNDV